MASVAEQQAALLAAINAAEAAGVADGALEDAKLKLDALAEKESELRRELDERAEAAEQLQRVLTFIILYRNSFRMLSVCKKRRVIPT